jgi:hypothetical protein
MDFGPVKSGQVLRPSITGVDEPAAVWPASHTAPASPGPQRLVGVGDRERATAERDVALANRLASGMRPDDARWVLALRVAGALEGGKAAVITPERRQGLISAGRRVGLRDFDTNLLIALVQDGRRSGRGALNLDVEKRLALLPEPEHTPDAPRWWLWASATLILAGSVLLALQAWVSQQPIP